MRRRPKPVEDWRAFASAFLQLKVERDELQRQVGRLRRELEAARVREVAFRSRIAALAEENGEGGW